MAYSRATACAWMTLLSLSSARHADIFGLPAIVAAIQVGIAKQRPALLIEQTALRAVVIRVGLLAVPRQAALAEKAPAAGDGEWHNDAVPFPEPGHSAARFLDNPHKLMAQHHFALLRDEPVVDMQIRPANRRCGYSQDNIIGSLIFRIRHGIDGNLAGTMENECFHF